MVTIFREMNDIRQRAGLILLEMSYSDAVDIFQELGVDPVNLSKEELKKHYRSLIQKHHPDRGGDANLAKDIVTAYQILIKDEKKPKTYTQRREPQKRETPTWAWAGYSGGLPPYSDISREDYTDVNYIKKRMWELSNKSTEEWTIWQFDGNFFRNAFVVYGNKEIFRDMAEAMKTWGERGNPYPTEAIFAQNKTKPQFLYLIYLGGKYISSNNPILEHESFNMNPGNDIHFVNSLPNQLKEIRQELGIESQ
jgi:curved DNA-binding protein CbpA